MFEHVVLPAFELLDAGGFVMPWLVVCCLLLWAGLGWRFVTLQRGSLATARVLLCRYRDGHRTHVLGQVDRAARACVDAGMRYGRVPRAILDERLGGILDELGAGRILVRNIVAVAPLAGLLGTVTGMIETFKSLADMALFTQGGGIAGGIGEALLTTQMGLAVAVPGIVLGRVLDRREELLRNEIEEMAELVAAMPLERITERPAAEAP